jgi:hypothetical protein
MSNTKDYRLNEIKKIKNLRMTNDEGCNIRTIIDCQIEFDLQEPKIRFRSTSVSRLVLLQEMCRIANEHGLFGDSNGSHICLSLNSSDILNGYIHISGDYFYQIHPIETDRNRFLENFSNHNDYYIET